MPRIQASAGGVSRDQEEVMVVAVAVLAHRPGIVL